MKSPINNCHTDFPALQRLVNDRTLVFLDGPGGSQVPQQVINAISEYYQQSNANTHGHFVTTWETDLVIKQAREHMAAFLGAEGPQTISFGQNMTSLNYSLSKALARHLQPGQEILITQLDHEANRGPWLRLQEQGFTVKEVGLKDDGTLDYEDFKEKIGPQTGLVAVGYASNALGTVNDLPKITEWCRQHQAMLLVDAVHYAPHFKIDVKRLRCDFLLCSAYKFYGPHVGILYSRPELLDQLDTDRLRTQDQIAPYKIETGTLNHAALAGVTAAVRYLAGFGEGPTLTEQLQDAFTTIQQHEFQLTQQLYRGLEEIRGLQIVGPPLDPQHHTPTLSFTLEGYTPEQVCRELGNRNICAWDGHFYALRAIEVMGLLAQGGVTRLGISMYTTKEDIEYTIKCVTDLTVNKAAV
ncbi:MAG: cysteine desulfurase-like protein [Cyclobacteriaceae bacterium]|nr:cysteine desulfurase-like protein [Cyclobacteriaceae bacterium]